MTTTASISDNNSSSSSSSSMVAANGDNSSPFRNQIGNDFDSLLMKHTTTTSNHNYTANVNHDDSILSYNSDENMNDLSDRPPPLLSQVPLRVS